MRWNSTSRAHTIRIAKQFAKLLRPGDVIGLVGPLGSGKTLFIQGLCEGLGIDKKDVVSPTFTLIHHYDGGVLPVYHFDVYRLESDREFEDLGYEEQFFGDGVTVVEWADKVQKFLPPGSRVLTFKSTGPSSRQIICRRKSGKLGT